MILKLVLKDLRAFGLRLFFFLLLLLSFNCFMASNDRSASWWLFILITSAGVSTIIPVFIVLENNYKGEILSCSLPVSRKEIILSKFSLLFLTAIVGYIFIYIAAFIMDSTLNYSDFYIFTNPLMLLIAFTYFSILISITILIMSTTANTLWIIIADLTFLVVFILGLEKIIFPGGIPASSEILERNIVSIIIVFTSVVLILYGLVKISIRKYMIRDI